ncbi:signal peptidase I [Microbacterium sp. H83]|uniref:signal peptidase I n=1 Tax=Microbacterium sp. H83 TaxID=1827324 RepID=UPI0007F47F4F|nr:signal peptidase I [Microbacterium sp. H83]OAN36592.1 S26 family signal peptidase [Microbacterium sp. H83]
MDAPTTRRALREQEVGRALDGGRDTAPHRRGGVGRALGDVVLWIAAAAGVVCMVLVVLALTANITLIMFRTGSMSPTIPAGSVAVVQQIPASAVEVGDVVTVDRVDDLPVTHRVTSVSAGATAAERVLTMRGDANSADDPYPYPVRTVRTVLFSVPGIASVIVALGDPVVLGTLTVAATALVVWAFWPRRVRDGRRTSGAEP